MALYGRDTRCLCRNKPEIIDQGMELLVTLTLGLSGMSHLQPLWLILFEQSGTRLSPLTADWPCHASSQPSTTYILLWPRSVQPNPLSTWHAMHLYILSQLQILLLRQAGVSFILQCPMKLYPLQGNLPSQCMHMSVSPSWSLPFCLPLDTHSFASDRIEANGTTTWIIHFMTQMKKLDMYISFKFRQITSSHHRSPGFWKDALEKQ